jgi:stage II sporulation protein D
MLLSLDSQSFSGSFICVAGAKRSTISLINALPVEEYLRGVVPLEIGRRSEKELEALKAQAVAARTYTYRKIMEHRDSTYDLMATVADQVYGGLSAGAEFCNRAIAATAGKVLIFDHAPILAYYHSTCGGSTANIEDVWKKKPVAYLEARSDRDADGNAYCSQSSYSSWTEEWKTETLAAILQKYGTSSVLKGTVKAPIKQVKIVKRFADGRIALLRVTSAAGTAEYGGDAIRMAFRQAQSGHPILQSARFEIVKSNRHQVIVKGSGYGHGVGMCQMGAIGRAQAGQSFEDILDAYYKGAELVTVKLDR